MKNIAIICCFILITVFSAGSYFVYLGYLNSYKKEFKSYIFQNKQKTISTVLLINPSELYTNSTCLIWEDENKEIIYKGILFDILQIKSSGKKVAITVISDQQEMMLKKRFNEMFDSESNKTTKNPFSLLKNFFAFKYIINDPYVNFKINEVNLTLFYSSKVFQLFPVYLSQDTPPPDYIA